MEQKNTSLPAFVIDAPATIEWPVKVTHPVDGGELASFCFTGIFKRLPEAELDALLGAEEPGTPAQESEPDEKKRMATVLEENATLFQRVLVGWRDVLNADRTAVPFDEERLAAAVRGPNGPYLSAGLWRAVAEIRAGARVGN